MSELTKNIKDLSKLIQTAAKMSNAEWQRDERSKSYTTKETYINMLKNKIQKYKSMIDNGVNEATTTGAVAGVSTPFAFSRKTNSFGNERSAKKSGYSVVEKSVYEGRNKKKIGKILNKYKKSKVNESIDLKIEEDVNKLDVSDIYQNFQSKLNNASNELKKSLQKSLLQKLLGKKIQATSSKGQGQVVSDYFIHVTGVEIDFYKNKYVVVIIGKEEGKSSTKRFFLNANAPITVFGDSKSLRPKDLERISNYKQMFNVSSDNNQSLEKNVTSDDSPQEPEQDQSPNVTSDQSSPDDQLKNQNKPV